VEEKTVNVMIGSNAAARIVAITLNGVGEDERLTPKLARRAAHACGHYSSVTVSDGIVAYRLYARSARKLKLAQLD
jgi:hypothetical protein